jgi:hypothetical protein
VAIDRQQLPGAGHTTQLDAAAVLEAGARPDDQVTHGAGDEDVAGAGLGEDPRRDVYRDSPDVGVQQLALAGVDASADLEAAGEGHAAYGWHMRAAAWATNRDIAAARLSWERAQTIADASAGRVGQAPDDDVVHRLITPQWPECGSHH